MVNLIWATRGRTWGFRFLLDGGFSDPLLVYERAFAGTQGDVAVCRRMGDELALRLRDPLNRTDDAGRVIPHDFVVRGALSNELRSVDDGLREVWPLVADVFASVWDATVAPTPTYISAAIRPGAFGLS
jgi:hypothetical protein